MPSNFDNDYTKSVAMKAAKERADRLLNQLGAEEAPAAPAEPTMQAVQEVTPEAAPEEEGGFLHDVGSFIKELPEQLVGGIYDALNNTVDLARDMGEGMGVPNYALQWKNEEGDWEWKFLNPEEVEAKGGLDKVLPEFSEATTAGGDVVRALSTFATGFIPVSKGLSAAGMAAGAVRGLAAGAVADAVTMDPHQARLATLLNEVPALGAVIPDYLADNDPANESEWEGRIKNVIEGAVLGGLSEGAIKGVSKVFKGYKVAAQAEKAAVKGEAVTAESALKQMDEVSEQTAKAVDEFALGSEGVIPEPAGDVYINMSRINSEKDVKELLKKVADAEAPALNKGSKTFEGIKLASKDEMKSVNDLLGRPTDRPFTAEEAVAARDILTTSAENLSKYATMAADGNATPEAIYGFRKALALHNDIQTKVFGGRKATAQALASWRIESKSAASRAKAIREVLGDGTKDSAEMAKAIADVAAKGGNVSEMAAKMTSQTWKDAHYQVWINGLLSSPSTHAANAISNTGTTLMSIPEKYVTAGFEMMTGANGSALKEANARAAGLISGIKDGFKLMTGSVDNAAIMTNASKLEGRAEAISATAWGKQPDSVIGKGLDYLGKAIGLPGWALEKSDNFFKGVNYRMMLNEKATKQAFDEGLKGSAFKARVAELVSNPTEPIMDVASDFAKYQTFTGQAGDFTKGVQKMINATPGGRYIMPFVRTPSNILSYGFERTPLAPMMGSVREDIKAGGSKAAAAYAKMACGSTLMAGAASLTLDGKVTGGGPSNPDERRALEETGWQPYSVKAGDKYISYERLEPIGSLIAYAADITSIMGQLDEDGGDELVAAGLAAFARNLGNKSFLSGVTQFVDVMNSGQPKTIEKWAQKLAAGMIAPVGSSLVKKTNNYFDDVKRDYTPDDVNGFLKSTFMLASENIPGMGKDAPPMRDVWGEIQNYSDGIASPIDVMSPIKLSTDKNDPVNEMIAENRIPLTRPDRNLMGVKMTNQEYSRFCEISGKRAKQELDRAYADGLFDNMSDGPDGEKALIIKRIITNSRQYAKSELIMDTPELEDRIYQNKLEKESKLMGEK